MTRACLDTVEAQIRQRRRVPVSDGVFVLSQRDYHGPLAAVFYKGAGFGRFEGTKDLRAELMRENELRRAAEARVSALTMELQEANSRRTVAEQELGKVQRQFELYLRG